MRYVGFTACRSSSRRGVESDEALQVASSLAAREEQVADIGILLKQENKSRP